MNRIPFVTVCTRSRLGEASILGRSLAETHPDSPRRLYLVEEQVRPGDDACGWDVVPLPPTPGGRQRLFQYGPLELCCSFKPVILADTFRDPGVEGAVYLDIDMLALAPFRDLVEEGWREADVWLTPHLRTTKPAPSFPLFLVHGAFNAGFIAVKNGPDGRAFLDWFQARLARDCMRDYGNSLFVDQKWLDLAAAACPGVRVLRHPGVNAAHWNLHEHAFEERPDGSIWLDGAVRLALFHFSGLTDQALSSHQPGQEAPEAVRALAQRHRESLAEAEARFPADVPYPYGTFRDGAPIRAPHREAVRLGRYRGDDPFADRAGVERAAEGVVPPPPNRDRAFQADAQLRRLRAHPVIGRVWRFWKTWVNHDLP